MGLKRLRTLFVGICTFHPSKSRPTGVVVHDILFNGLHRTLHAGLFAFEYLNVVSGLEDGDCSRSGDNQEVYMCVVLGTIFTMGETSDFVKRLVGVVELNGSGVEILVDEAVLELVVLEEVNVIPPYD